MVQQMEEARRKERPDPRAGVGQERLRCLRFRHGEDRCTGRAGWEAAMIWTLRPEMAGMVDRMITTAYQRSILPAAERESRACDRADERLLGVRHVPRPIRARSGCPRGALRASGRVPDLRRVHGTSAAGDRVRGALRHGPPRHRRRAVRPPARSSPTTRSSISRSAWPCISGSGARWRCSRSTRPAPSISSHLTVAVGLIDVHASRDGAQGGRRRSGLLRRGRGRRQRCPRPA